MIRPAVFTLLAVTVAAPAAQAAHFAYDGNVGSTFGGAAFDSYLGAPMRIDVLFGNVGPDIDPDPNHATFNPADGLVILSVAGISYTALNPVFGISDDDPSSGGLFFDLVQINASSSVAGPVVGGLSPRYLELLFQTATNTTPVPPLSSTDVPSMPFDPAGFEGVEMRVVFGTNTQLGIISTGISRNAIRLAPVPEPSGVVLFSAGVLSLLVLQRKRFRN